MCLSALDREHLQLFRKEAQKVRDASIIDRGQRPGLSGALNPSGDMVITTELLGNEAFLALAISIRLVYMKGERMNFGHICDILRLCGTDTAKTESFELRRRYNQALKKHPPGIAIIAFRGQSVPPPRKVFETWLNHGVFHHDERWREKYEALSEFGDSFLFAVQGIALQLAGRILDLDDVVADFLEQPRVERIAP